MVTFCAICCGVAGTGATSEPPVEAGSNSTQVVQVLGVGAFGVVLADGPCHSGMGVSPVAFTRNITGLVSTPAKPTAPGAVGWYGASSTFRSTVAVLEGQALFNAIKLDTEV